MKFSRNCPLQSFTATRTCRSRFPQSAMTRLTVGFDQSMKLPGNTEEGETFIHIKNRHQAIPIHQLSRRLKRFARLHQASQMITRTVANDTLITMKLRIIARNAVAIKKSATTVVIIVTVIVVAPNPLRERTQKCVNSSNCSIPE